MRSFFGLITILLPVYVLSATSLASAQSPVPPAGEQSTADCAKPVYASDQLVCTNAGLRLLDARLKSVLSQTRETPAGVLQETDSLWFKRRSRCAFEIEHDQCLIEAYTDRIETIEAMNEGINPTKIATCKGLGKIRRVLLTTSTDGQIIIRDSFSQIIGIASSKSKYRIWEPVIGYTDNNKKLNFESSNGMNFYCQLR